LVENEASPAPAGGRRLRCRAAARRWREGSIMVGFELRLCAPLGPLEVCIKIVPIFLKKIKLWLFLEQQSCQLFGDCEGATGRVVRLSPATIWIPICTAPVWEKERRNRYFKKVRRPAVCGSRLASPPTVAPRAHGMKPPQGSIGRV
jgi:hypothetical protein